MNDTMLVWATPSIMEALATCTHCPADGSNHWTSATPEYPEPEYVMVAGYDPPSTCVSESSNLIVTSCDPAVTLAPKAAILGWTASFGLGDGLGVGVDVALGVGLAIGGGVGVGEALADTVDDGLGAVALHAGASAAKTAIKAIAAATDPLTSPLRRIAPPSLSRLRVTLG